MHSYDIVFCSFLVSSLGPLISVVNDPVSGMGLGSELRFVLVARGRCARFFGVTTAARGRSGALVPEVVQAHGDRN